MVRAAGFCFQCLKAGHMSRSCHVTCRLCGGSHAPPLCDTNMPTSRKGTTGMKFSHLSTSGYPQQTLPTPWQNYTPQTHIQSTTIPDTSLHNSGSSGTPTNATTMATGYNQHPFTQPFQTTHTYLSNQSGPTAQHVANTRENQGFQQILLNPNPPGKLPSGL